MTTTPLPIPKDDGEGGHEATVVLLLVYTGMALMTILTSLTISLLGAIIFTAHKTGIPELQRMTNVLPTALESLTYAEIPIAVVGVIANYMKFTVDDVAAEYNKDATKRKSIVLQTFKKDPVTDSFIQEFPSKFIQHGYCGEELLN